MLDEILGSRDRERVLMFLLARKQGYAREIARFFKTGADPIGKQLERLESAGVLVSHPAGRTRLYEFNPRYPFLAELQSLLRKALEFYPDQEREELLMARRRPRRKDKPL